MTEHVATAKLRVLAKITELSTRRLTQLIPQLATQFGTAG